MANNSKTNEANCQIGTTRDVNTVLSNKTASMPNWEQECKYLEKLCNRLQFKVYQSEVIIELLVKELEKEKGKND